MSGEGSVATKLKGARNSSRVKACTHFKSLKDLIKTRKLLVIVKSWWYGNCQRKVPSTRPFQ